MTTTDVGQRISGFPAVVKRGRLPSAVAPLAIVAAALMVLGPSSGTGQIVALVLGSVGAGVSAWMLRRAPQGDRRAAWLSTGYLVMSAGMLLEARHLGRLLQHPELRELGSAAAATSSVWQVVLPVCVAAAVVTRPLPRSLPGGVMVASAISLVLVAFGVAPGMLVSGEGPSVTTTVLGIATAVGAVGASVVWSRARHRTDAWQNVPVRDSLLLSAVGAILSIGGPLPGYLPAAGDALSAAGAIAIVGASVHGTRNSTSREDEPSSVPTTPAVRTAPATRANLLPASRAVPAPATQSTLTSTEIRTKGIITVPSPRPAILLPEEERRAAADEIRSLMQDESLAMVLQPIFDSRSGELIGAEAFARFNTPCGKGPDYWFRRAAMAGRGVDLERAALRKALELLGEVPYKAFLAINVSAATLVSQGLLHDLEGVSPGRVVLELTEHSPVDDYKRLAAAVARLRARGHILAIDDAGAANSTLRNIVRLAPQIIKLDGTLTRNLHVDPVRSSLISTLIDFAERNRMRIVAEGVETADELRTLRNLEVHALQGYYLAIPAAPPLLQESPVLRQYVPRREPSLRK